MTIRDRALPNFFVGIILASITVLLLFFVGRGLVTSGIEQVLTVIAGMTLIATFSALHHFLDGMKQAPRSDISFDEAFIKKSLPESNGQQSRYLKEWELTPAQMVGVDNALALAKLRIEIEQEMRRIAHDHKISLPARLLSPVSLAQDLAGKGAIDVTLLGALKEVLKVCNQGIHGADINSETTTSVVNVGNQLLEQLRSV